MRLHEVARSLILHYLPTRWIRRLKALQIERRQGALREYPPLTEAEFRSFLGNRLGVGRGATVFVHSSVDLLHLDFSPLRLLEILLDMVGPEGTLLFPSFPAESMYEFLRQGKVFDVRRTPGGTGLLGELARRHRGARRSLNPTRSVVAIGRLREEFVAHHHESPYPFAKMSPFGLLAPHRALIIGLGVSTKNLTHVHALDDAFPEQLPFSPYSPVLFQASCRDDEGREVVVPTYAHDQRRMRYSVPRFIRRHIDPGVAEDLRWRNMDFFKVDAAPFYDRLVELANRGITLYRD